MKHFNFKSLAFYGGAIAAVVVLFEIVTTYGESRLKAPPSIEGRYPLSFTQNLPDCLKSDAPVLTIQQSGTYLSASLLPAKTNDKPATAAEKKLSLTGQLSNQQLSISGASSSKICHNLVPQAEASGRPQDNHPSQVNIQGRVEGKNLEGKMTLSGIPEAIGFTAQAEAPAQSSEKSTSH